MRIERLGDLGDGPSVLRALATATHRLGLPPPAALIGEWFGSRAVIAPSLSSLTSEQLSRLWDSIKAFLDLQVRSKD